MAKRVLVTGGAGFIGSHLTRALLERGDEVHVLDNFSTGSKENLEDIKDQIVLHEADLRDAEAVAKSLTKVDWVFHEAALPSVPRSMEEPKLSHDINVNGSLELLLAARKAGVEAIVMASSSSVYGDTPTLPKHEAMMPRPQSPYALQKLAMEQMGQTFARCYDMNITSLRYFNVFGPRQNPHSTYAAVVPKFITKLLAEQAPVIFGDGEQSRDFTYVGNVVAANIAAAQQCDNSALVANVALGQAITVNELTAKLAHLLDRDHIQPLYESARPGDIVHSLADITRAQQSFAFEAAISFEQGLKITVDWYVKSLEEGQ